MNDEAVLRLTGISKTFGGVYVLRDVSLSLYAGEVHCLMGENGAGKSTLIKIISGAYHADAGAMDYQGETLTDVTPRWARENGINTIYQEIDLVPHITAVENILLGEEPLTPLGNIDGKKATARARELFDKLGVDIVLDVPVSFLPLAQQQMVAIAKAMHLNSKVIIFDEPTSVFTANEVGILFRIINDLKAEGMAILYISHHMEEIFEIGDRITVLRDGELIKTAPVEEFTRESLIQAMVGRNIVFSRDDADDNRGEVVLEAKNLCVGNVVRNVSFTLHRREILGFGGLVGAGRTESMRALVGADKLDSGEILLHDKKVAIRSPRHALGLGIGMLPESRKVDGIVAGRPVGDNITYSFVERTFRHPFPNWRKVKQKAQEMVEKMTVRPPEMNKLIRYLSGGNQQKVVLGKLLAAECDIIILDEPTRGVDVGARTEIYAIMKKLLAAGKAIIMVSSDMTELLTQSDRIMVMSEGRVVRELKGSEATEEEVLALALKEEE